MPKRYIRRTVQYFVVATIFLFSIGFLAASGSQQRADDGKDYSDSLVVARFSKTPEYRKFPDGHQQLIYVNENEYPAEDVVSFLKVELKRRGWKLLPQMFFNPEQPSSYVSGWDFVLDRTQKPSKNLWQWAADWENERHDITEYFLQYESPTNSSRNLQDLQVFALYFPAEIAAKSKRDADRVKREIEPKK